MEHAARRAIWAACLSCLPFWFPQAWGQSLLPSEKPATERAKVQEKKSFSLKALPLSEEEKRALPKSYHSEGDSILDPDGKVLTQEQLLALLRFHVTRSAAQLLEKKTLTDKDRRRARWLYLQRYALLEEDQRENLRTAAGLNLPSSIQIGFRIAAYRPSAVQSYFGARGPLTEQRPARQAFRPEVAAEGYFVDNSYRSANYIVRVRGGDRVFARQVAEQAESYRDRLARKWGILLSRSGNPVPIEATVDPGAGGATHLKFHKEGRIGASIQVQGSKQAILDTVLPHEINHTIFAAHFGVPLPRWADEGAASVVESAQEQQKLRHNLYELWRQGGEIRNLRALFQDMNYPQNDADMMALYAQGHSVTQFLLQRKGEQGYLSFIQDGLNHDWDYAARKNYGLSVENMQQAWMSWVQKGSPESPSKPAMAPGANVGSLVAVGPSAKGFAPDFTFTGPDGRPMKLSDLRGKPVLLDFSLADCPPCRQASGLLKELHAQYADDLAIVAVHTGAESLQGLKEHAIEEGIEYPIVHDPDAKVEQSLGRQGGYPYFMLLDAQGRKVWDQEGYQAVDRADFKRRVAQEVGASAGSRDAGSLEGEASLAGRGFDGSADAQAGSAERGGCSGGSCSGAGSGGCSGGSCSGGGSSGGGAAMKGGAGGAKRGVGCSAAKSAQAADGSPDRDVGGPGLWLLTVVLARLARKARRLLNKAGRSRRRAKTRARLDQSLCLNRRARGRNSSRRKSASPRGASRKPRARVSPDPASRNGDISRT